MKQTQVRTVIHTSGTKYISLEDIIDALRRDEEECETHEKEYIQGLIERMKRLR